MSPRPSEVRCHTAPKPHAPTRPDEAPTPHPPTETGPPQPEIRPDNECPRPPAEPLTRPAHDERRVSPRDQPNFTQPRQDPRSDQAQQKPNRTKEKAARAARDPPHTTPHPTHTSNKRTRKSKRRRPAPKKEPQREEARNQDHRGKLKGQAQEAKPSPDQGEARPASQRRAKASEAKPKRAKQDPSEASEAKPNPKRAKRAREGGCWSTPKATKLGQQELAPWGSGGSPPRMGRNGGKVEKPPNRVGEGGVEPPRPYGHTDLNRARLPFRHSPRVNVAKPTRSAIGFAHRTVLQARHGYDRPRSTSVEGGTHGRHR
jgi:hypothetical protein